MRPISRMRQIARILAPTIVLLALSMALAPASAPERRTGVAVARLIFAGLPVAAVTAALPVIRGRS